MVIFPWLLAIRSLFPEHKAEESNYTLLVRSFNLYFINKTVGYMQYTDSYNLLDIGAFEVSVVLLVVFSTNSEVVELLIGISMSFKGFFGDLDSCAV